MSDESLDIAASAAGEGAPASAPASAEPASGAVSTDPRAITIIEESAAAKAAAGTKDGAAPAAPAAGDPNVPRGTTPPVLGADGKPVYAPNFKYKAAGAEKEIDEFFKPLVKDADSEKKVKEFFAKVDAFDYQKGKRESVEQQLQSLAGDFQQQSQIVQRFNKSVQEGDLSSAFRLAGVTKDQVFKWTQQQLQIMELPPEQRQQYEQAESVRAQNFELQEQVSQMRSSYENQAVMARTIQLDVALLRPEVAQFANAWDQNADQSGAFKNFVIGEAQKMWHDTKQDLPPEKVVEVVMQKFGKFLNVGNGVAQPGAPVQPAAAGQRAAPPVIPNVAGKAASPVKKVPRTLDDLKALAKSMPG